ncbi:MAG TPA: Smr/MutS family protein [Verrucomicrobiae bacterium]|nr:Smr/MutS family protein [Verrucomicrobiae bacterium]
MKGWITLLCVDEPLEVPINGVLDLHTFQPRQVKELVADYLDACRQRGIFRVRIIHGKGIGQLRQTVRAILARHPDVISFSDDHALFGGWGATVAELRPRSEKDRVQ